MSQKQYKVKSIYKDGEGDASINRIEVVLEPIGGVGTDDVETLSQVNGSSNLTLIRTNATAVTAFTPAIGDTVVVKIEAP